VTSEPRSGYDLVRWRPTVNDDVAETETSGVNRDRITTPAYRDLLRMRRPSEVFCLGDTHRPDLEKDGAPPEGATG
jgi:hypothetical protein